MVYQHQVEGIRNSTPGAGQQASNPGEASGGTELHQAQGSAAKVAAFGGIRSGLGTSAEDGLPRECGVCLEHPLSLAAQHLSLPGAAALQPPAT